jgi:hypothetical protein
MGVNGRVYIFGKINPMKKTPLPFLALLLGWSAFAQTGPMNLEQFTDQGATGNIFAQMRKVKNIKSDLPTVGSVYIDESFKPCQIYYNQDLVGDFYYRHNAFNDEIEIKDTPSPADKEVSSLMALRQLRLVDSQDNTELSLHVYQTKEENLRNGYLYEVSTGPKYNLYSKNNVKYTQGTHPVTSLTRPTPNKFSHFVEYYLTRNGEETAFSLGKNKGDFLKTVDSGIRNDVKDYIKEEKINLKDEADLIRLFGFMNTLAGADSHP